MFKEGIFIREFTTNWVLAFGTARELPIQVNAVRIVLGHPGFDAVDKFASRVGTGNHLGEI